MKIAFSVPGTPVPKERARLGGNGAWYTPSKTVGFESKVRVFALQAMARAGWPVRTKARCSVTAYVHWSNARPRDIDNTIKAITDAMNDLIYADDRQVFEIHVFKCVDSANPRVEIEVELLPEASESAPRM